MLLARVTGRAATRRGEFFTGAQRGPSFLSSFTTTQCPLLLRPLTSLNAANKLFRKNGFGVVASLGPGRLGYTGTDRDHHRSSLMRAPSSFARPSTVQPADYWEDPPFDDIDEQWYVGSEGSTQSNGSWGVRQFSTSATGKRTGKPPMLTTKPMIKKMPPTDISSLPKLNIDVNNLSQHIVSVTDIPTALDIVRVLESYPDAVWACDTEVAEIEVKTQSPVGNGRVTCISIYGGPDIDFGTGSGPGSILWIETIDGAEGVLDVFKAWFENPRYKKVWHNYGFDRHVMFNMGVNCLGFYGDTMHMARLEDTSRDKLTGGGEGYSLESLSTDYLQHMNFNKIGMKELFGVAIKTNADGSESKLRKIPNIYDLQRDPKCRNLWIEYSSRDALATWHLYSALVHKLKQLAWIVGKSQIGNMMDYYNAYMSDFGTVLTEMERNGIRVDTTGHLKSAEIRAREEKAKMEKIFYDWLVQRYGETAKYINPGSSIQMGQLFFGHYKDEVLIERTRVFEVEKSEEDITIESQQLLASNKYAGHKMADLKVMLKERKLKLAGKRSELIARLMEDDYVKATGFDHMSFEELQNACIAKGLEFEGSTKEELLQRLVEDAKFLNSYQEELNRAEIEERSKLKKIRKKREVSVETLGMRPLAFTPTGSAQVSAALLRKMSGSNVFGDEKDAVFAPETMKFFGGGEAGKEACRAIGALANIGQIDSTITNFLEPLQRLVDKESRIHCSLNLNTETGRLSARRPNLQNQPALEKDQYKIRDAFIASPGNTLIVADYGQLELRLLAHITNCRSMIDAFAQGGCFHSRTAVGMYPYIREAVDTGKVLLEWDYSKGQPDVPLVKDTYASERRKAKTLNFSIAYGKTVHGLAQDWGITKEEAQETLSAWYNDRPEVKKWQLATQEGASREGYVRTLMGRYRRLPEAGQRTAAGSHALRAAINTPIQGSAADVVMMAMIKIWKSQVLRDMGWKLLLQIHDEVILEGPKETMPEALAEVRSCMENPFDHFGLHPLSVHLDVDAKSADSWYKAK